MEEFEKVIKAHLEEVAAKDEAFAAKYEAKGNDSVARCCEYIITEVRKSNRECLTDDEVYGMAMHYYDEDITVEGIVPRCRVVVPATPEMAEADRERITAEARKRNEEEAIKAEQERLRKKDEAAAKRVETLRKKAEEKAAAAKKAYEESDLLFHFEDEEDGQ